MEDKTESAVKQSQVAAQCQELSENVEVLFKAIETLASRLADVVHTVPEKDLANKALEEKSLVKHASFLRDKNKQLRRAIEQLESLEHRIEL